MHARMLEPMRPDPPRNLWAGRGGMVLCTAWAVVLLLGLTRCVLRGDASTACLEQHDDPADCCYGSLHKDQWTCCHEGEHALCDIQHPKWCLCVPDEDAGIDEADAGADAATDAGIDALP
jgi:hypothetical protein